MNSVRGLKADCPEKTVSPPVARTVCAVVVAFFPDLDFEEHLRILLPQVGALVVVDNTPELKRERHIAVSVEEEKQIRIIENRSNVGVASALNQGLEQALEWDFAWMLALDQDSYCLSDMVQTLANVYAACELKPVVIGGNYLDPRNNRTKIPASAAGGFLEQKTVITSGSLIDTVFARAISGFREDFFIDQLDHEFCLRARSRGGFVVISRKPVMKHSVGETGGAWFPFLGHLPNHPPLRKYYIARNSLVTIAEYWRLEPDWCLRRLIRLLMGAVSMFLLEKHGYSKLRAFACGVTDAMHRRMGPCQRKWLCDQ